MARKKKHEEHVNAEAWAIPYGDLVTLLFALFTVMYAVSSVNEGKFRILSDSMIAALNGAPKTVQPINVGQKQQTGKEGDKQLVGVSPTALMRLRAPQSTVGAILEPMLAGAGATLANQGSPEDGHSGSLLRMEHEVQEAMKPLIDAKLVSGRRENLWLEIESNSDILFPSGAGDFASAAEPVLDKLADVLKPFPNPIRVEGHTDDRPIHSAVFPSNWELSAARAASVVHQFMKAGVDPQRLEIVGFGELHPRSPNDSAEGRNANRRVAVLVLEDVESGAGGPGSGSPASADETAGSGNGPGTAPGNGPGNGVVSGMSPNPSKFVQPPAQHIGPVELIWPGSSSPDAKAPAPHHDTHE